MGFFATLFAAIAEKGLAAFLTKHLPMIILGFALWAVGIGGGWYSHKTYDDWWGYSAVRAEALKGYVAESELIAANAKAKKVEQQLSAALLAQNELNTTLQDISERYRKEDQQNEMDRAAYQAQLAEAQASLEAASGNKCSRALTQRDVEWLHRRGSPKAKGSK